MLRRPNATILYHNGSTFAIFLNLATELQQAHQGFGARLKNQKINCRGTSHTIIYLE